MKVIGLTGNIGCGKSTVAGMLRELGAVTIDADRVAREIRRNDADARAAILARFGTDDPQALGRVVFTDADALVKVYTEIACHPHMVEMHHGANPQIEVLDESNARGKWSLQYFLINTKEKTLTQLGGYYDDEYRKEGGKWKISRTKFYATSTLAMENGEKAIRALFAGAPPAA